MIHPLQGPWKGQTVRATRQSISALSSMKSPGLLTGSSILSSPVSGSKEVFMKGLKGWGTSSGAIP